MKKLLKLSFLFILATFLVSSCITTKTSVGKFKETQENEYIYAKGKQVWLF